MSGTSAAPEILFHHPAPLTHSPTKGSQLRPRRMVDAFAELGYRVVEVTGHGDERVPHMKRLRGEIAAGRRFEFCYAECVNSPTPLSDPSHLPRHPLADPLFFRDLRRAGIPSSMFYRDIYWRFDHYRETVPLPKRLPAQTFHRYDLAWYGRFVDVVYLPSARMASAVPRPGRFDLRPLPPGTAPAPGSGVATADGGPLRILYIGSISPPYYDIGTLLGAVRGLEGVELTLNFPDSEIHQLERHPRELLEGVRTSHAMGDGVHALYENAEIASVVLGTDPYRDFAVPVKLLEAIGHGKPCLVNSGTAAADLVGEGGFGWAVRGEEDLRVLLADLVADRHEVDAVAERVREGASGHTWLARARQVADEMTDLRAR